MHTKRRIVEAAIEKLKTGWTQGEMAEDRAGRPVGSTSHEACRWCLLGALRAAGAPADDSIFSALHRALRRRCAKESPSGGVALSLVAWNDAPERTRDDVISLLKEVAEDLN